jgi:hypothetical protein
MSDDRIPVGYVTATVQIPLYEGDRISADFGLWDWFEFKQPGITEGGEIGVCIRPVKLIQASVTMTEEADV